MSNIKVNLYNTVEVSEEQRHQLAALLDGPGAKKRIATRDELKAFIWQHGKDWDLELSDQATPAADVVVVQDDDDDLI